jgi:hypothetical protein
MGLKTVIISIYIRAINYGCKSIVNYGCVIHLMEM